MGKLRRLLPRGFAWLAVHARLLMPTCIVACRSCSATCRILWRMLRCGTLLRLPGGGPLRLCEQTLSAGPTASPRAWARWCLSTTRLLWGLSRYASELLAGIQARDSVLACARASGRWQVSQRVLGATFSVDVAAGASDVSCPAHEPTHPPPFPAHFCTCFPRPIGTLDSNWPSHSLHHCWSCPQMTSGLDIERFPSDCSVPSTFYV